MQKEVLSGDELGPIIGDVSENRIDTTPMWRQCRRDR